MKTELIERIKTLASQGIQDVLAIQGEIGRRTVTETSEEVQEARETSALEGQAAVVIQRLVAAVKPGMSVAQLQQAPLPVIMGSINSALPGMTNAQRIAVLEDVVRLQVYYNALAAAGVDWRSPEFGAATRSVRRIRREENLSFAETQGEEVPSLHAIREVLAL